MSTDQLDLNGLARYLHLAPEKVQRLVNRGKIPGRKVGGRWVFSLPEIHQWLEERIGLTEDEEELHRLEEAFASQRAEERTIADLLPLEAVAVPLQARSQNSVIAQMVELAARTGWLWDPDRMAEAVRRREQLHTTALDSGVALLHPRRPLPQILERPFLAFGRTVQGVPFGGSRGILTDLFFLILSTEDRGHLHTLARLSRMLNDAEFLRQLRQAPDAAAAHELICRREAELD